MVEFAIENAQALKKRALRQTRVHEGAATKPSPRGRPESGSEAGTSAPGLRQQQQKRRREESEVLYLCTLAWPLHLSKGTFGIGEHLGAARCGSQHVCSEQLRTQEDSTLLSTVLHPLYVLLYTQRPRKSETDANGKAHASKEGRGQRQRRKKREGPGPDGQPGQPSAPSKPGKAAAGARIADAAGHVAAADVRPAKRLRQTRDPAGTSALYTACCRIESMHIHGL